MSSIWKVSDLIEPVEPKDGVMAAVAARRITRVRHFTTNSGITGILATGELRCRDALATDQYLDRIFLPNCETRVDPAWTGHVSISITDINSKFFAISSQGARWHAGMDGFWAIVEMEPEVLAKPGVVFATTNNRYTNCQRAEGVPGLEQLFADEIRPYKPVSTSPRITRHGLGDEQPTDEQAEVLYPGNVDVRHVKAILVETDEAVALVEPQVRYFADTHDVGHIAVRVDPSAFHRRVPGPVSLPPPGAD